MDELDGVETERSRWGTASRARDGELLGEGELGRSSTALAFPSFRRECSAISARKRPAMLESYTVFRSQHYSLALHSNAVSSTCHRTVQFIRTVKVQTHILKSKHKSERGLANRCDWRKFIFQANTSKWLVLTRQRAKFRGDWQWAVNKNT